MFDMDIIMEIEATAIRSEKGGVGKMIPMFLESTSQGPWIMALGDTIVTDKTTHSVAPDVFLVLAKEHHHDRSVIDVGRKDCPWIRGTGLVANIVIIGRGLALPFLISLFDFWENIDD
jgi:hypothetical protein